MLSLTKAYISASNAVESFGKNERGVTAIEYGLIAVAMAGLIVVVFYNPDGFISKLKSKFSTVTSKINDAHDVGDTTQK